MGYIDMPVNRLQYADIALKIRAYTNFFDKVMVIWKLGVRSRGLDAILRLHAVLLVRQFSTYVKYINKYRCTSMAVGWILILYKKMKRTVRFILFCFLKIFCFCCCKTRSSSALPFGIAFELVCRKLQWQYSRTRSPHLGENLPEVWRPRILP